VITTVGSQESAPGSAWVRLDHRSRSGYRVAAAVARNPGLTHNPGFSPAKETLGPSRLEGAAKTQRPAPGEFRSVGWLGLLPCGTGSLCMMRRTCA
jgi:hypothetical protein